MNLTDFTPKQLRKAATLQERILSLQHDLNQILGASASAAATKGPKKRKMSRAGRAAIAAGARARWAKIKGTKPGRKPKRKMTAAGRARLSAMAKARWKKAKAQGKATL